MSANKHEKNDLKRRFLKQKFNEPIQKRFIFLKTSLITTIICLIIYLANDSLFKKVNTMPISIDNPEMIDKDLRVGGGNIDYYIIDADYSENSNEFYLLTKTTVEVKNVKFNSRKSYSIDIHGKSIGVSTDHIFIATVSGEIYAYSKKMDNKTLVHGAQPSKVFKTMQDLKTAVVFPLSKDLLLLQKKEGTSDRVPELYDLKLKCFSDFPSKKVSGINSIKWISKELSLLACDTGLYAFSLNTNKCENLLKESIKDIYLKDHKLYVLYSNTELAEFELSNEVDKCSIHKTRTMIDSSLYKGSKIEYIDKNQDYIFIQDVTGGLYSYNIHRHAWKLIKSKIKRFYLSNSYILVQAEGGITVLDQQFSEINSLNSSAISVYPLVNDFLVITKGNLKNGLIRIGRTTNIVIPQNTAMQDLKDIDSCYLFKHDILIFKKGEKFLVYNTKTRGWQPDQNFIITGEVERIRKTQNKVYFQMGSDLYTYMNNKVSLVKSDIKSFEFYDQQLLTLNIDGSIEIGKLHLFNTEIPYHLNSIRKIVPISGSRILVIFEEGTSIYSPSKGAWTNTMSYNIVPVFLVELNNTVAVSDGKTVTFINTELGERGSISLIKDAELIDFKVLLPNQVQALYELKGKKIIQVFELDDITDSHIHVLSNALPVPSFKDFIYAEKLGNDLIIGSKNKIFSYNPSLSLWSEIYSGHDIQQIKVLSNRIFIDNGSPRQLIEVMPDGTEVVIASKYDQVNFVDGYILTLKKSKGIQLWDINDIKSPTNYFTGNLNIVGDIKSILSIKPFLYFTDSINLWKYNQNSYSFTHTEIGTRRKEFLNESGFYYLSKDSIQKVDLINLTNELLIPNNVDDFWINDQKISYLSGSRLNEINNGVVTNLFKSEAMPVDISAVTQFKFVNPFIYAITATGYAAYSIDNRSWTGYFPTNIKKTVIKNEKLYFLSDQGIFVIGGSKAQPLIKTGNIDDFTVVSDEVYYTQGGDLKNISNNNVYFTGSANNKVVSTFYENDFVRIFGGDNGLDIYSIKNHSWRNESTINPISIFENNSIIYVVCQREMFSYDKEMKLIENKEFSEDIVTVSEGDHKMAVLLQNGDVQYFDGHLWNLVESKGPAPLFLNTAKEVFYFDDKVYFTNSNGVYCYNNKVKYAWTTEAKGDFTGFLFKAYDGYIVLVGDNQAYYKKSSDSKWISVNIDNRGFSIIDGIPYYIKDKTLHFNNKSTRSKNNILQKLIGSFEHQGNYYYLSESGLSQYSPSTHTWEDLSFSYKINSYNINVHKDTLLLATTVGQVSIFLPNLTLNTEKLLPRFNILSVNDRYLVYKNRTDYILYDKVTGSKKLTKANDPSDIKKLEAATLFNNENILISQKGIYQYDTANKRYLLSYEHNLGKILNVGSFQGALYLYGENGKMWSEDKTNKNSYAHLKDTMMVVQNGKLFDYKNTGNGSLFSSIEDVYSHHDNTYYTASGTYIYDHGLNMFLKQNNISVPRFVSKNKMYQHTDDQIRIFDLLTNIQINAISYKESTETDIDLFLELTKNNKANIPDRRGESYFAKRFHLEHISYAHRSMINNKNKTRIQLLNKILRNDSIRDSFPISTKSLTTSDLQVNSDNEGIRAVILDLNFYYLIAKSHMAIVDRKSLLIQEPVTKLPKRLWDLKFLAQEDTSVITKTNSFFSSTNYYKLKAKSGLSLTINNTNQKRNKESVSYSKGVFKYSPYLQDGSVLSTESGTDEDAISQLSLKVETPTSFTLNTKNSYATVYPNKVKIKNTYYPIPFKSRIIFGRDINKFVISNEGRKTLLTGKKLKKSKLNSPFYYYLSNSILHKTHDYELFLKYIYDGAFNDDSFISMSNNGNGPVFLGTGAKVFKTDFKMVYKGEHTRVNTDQNSLVIKNGKSNHRVENQELISIDSLEPHYFIKLDDNGWSQTTAKSSDIECYKVSNRDQEFPTRFLPMDFVDGVSVDKRGLFLSYNGLLTKHSGNKRIYVNNVPLLAENTLFQYSGNKIKYLTSQTTDKYGFRYEFGKKITIEERSKFSKRYESDQLVNISSDNEKLYIAAKKGLYILEDDLITHTPETFDYLFELKNRVFAMQHGSYCELENDHKTLIESKPKSIVIIGPTVQNKIVFGMQTKTIRYYDFNDESVFHNNVFLFDAVDSLFMTGDLFYNIHLRYIVPINPIQVQKPIKTDEILNTNSIIYKESIAILRGINNYKLEFDSIVKADKLLFTTAIFSEQGLVKTVENSSKNQIKTTDSAFNLKKFFEIHQMGKLENNIYLFNEGITRANITRGEIKLEKSINSPQSKSISAITNMGQIVINQASSLRLNVNKVEIITPLREYNNIQVSISNTGFNLKIIKSPRLSWYMNGILGNDLFEQCKTESYFTFDNIQKIDNQNKFYASNRYIFGKKLNVKSYEPILKKNKIIDIKNTSKNRGTNLSIKLENSPSVRLVDSNDKEQKVSHSCYKKYSYDLKFRKQYITEDNKVFLSFNKKCFKDQENIKKLQWDEVSNIITDSNDTNTLLLSTEMGILSVKNSEFMTRSWLSKAKRIKFKRYDGIYADNGVDHLLINNNKVFPTQNMEVINQIVINNGEFSQRYVSNKIPSDKINKIIYNKGEVDVFSIDHTYFAWDDIQQFVWGEPVLTINKNSKVWNTLIYQDKIKSSEKSYMFEGKIHTYDSTNKIWTRYSNLDLLKLIDPIKLSLIRDKQGRWDNSYKGVKLELNGVVSAFNNQKLDFDAPQLLGDSYLSNEYLWKLEDYSFLSKIGNVEILYKGKTNLYFQDGIWYTASGIATDNLIYGSNEKMIWRFNPNNQVVDIKLNIPNSRSSRFKLGRFYSDEVNQIDQGNNCFWLSTKSGVFSYPIDLVTPIKPGKNITFFDKVNANVYEDMGTLSFSNSKTPTVLKNKNILAYYQRPFFFPRTNKLYYYAMKTGVHFIYDLKVGNKSKLENKD